MSHFNVAVFSHTPDEVDTLLAPFIEQVEPYSPYAVFEEDEDYSYVLPDSLLRFAQSMITFLMITRRTTS